jgi:hypothetical protein
MTLSVVLFVVAISITELATAQHLHLENRRSVCGFRILAPGKAREVPAAVKTL